MSTAITAQDVKALRDRTGAGIMDAKSALQESGGDVDKAIEILRVKGQASAAKRGGRHAAEGVVSSYIHAGGKIGVLVEVDCEKLLAPESDQWLLVLTPRPGTDAADQLRLLQVIGLQDMPAGMPGAAVGVDASVT